MTEAEILAFIESLVTSPLAKPIEEALLNQVRSALSGRPFLLALVNDLAAAVGL